MVMYTVLQKCNYKKCIYILCNNMVRRKKSQGLFIDR